MVTPLDVRHSWYRIVPHQHRDFEDISVRLKEVRLRHLRLLIRQRVDQAKHLEHYLLPLQALIDLTIDSTSNYVQVCSSTSPKHHHQDQPQLNRCNRLCLLTVEAKKALHDIEDQISEVIALQRQLLRDVETLEREAEAVMATGSPTTCCLDPTSLRLASPSSPKTEK